MTVSSRSLFPVIAAFSAHSVSPPSAISKRSSSLVLLRVVPRGTSLLGSEDPLPGKPHETRPARVAALRTLLPPVSRFFRVSPEACSRTSCRVVLHSFE
jgi:hypothetical protein